MGISRKAIDPNPLIRLSWRYSSWVSGCSGWGMSYRPRPRQSTTLALPLQLHSFGQACEKGRRDRRIHSSTAVEKAGHYVGPKLFCLRNQVSNIYMYHRFKHKMKLKFVGMIFPSDIYVPFPQKQKSKLAQTPTISETVALSDFNKAR